MIQDALLDLFRAVERLDAMRWENLIGGLDTPEEDLREDLLRRVDLLQSIAAGDAASMEAVRDGLQTLSAWVEGQAELRKRMVASAWTRRARNWMHA